MTYERAIVTGLPRRKKMAHLSRALQAIWQLIAPDTIRQNTLAHPEGWHFAPGTIDVGPFEFRTDARGNVIDLRRALHAERRGVFANLPLGEAWGLLQIPLLRGLLQHDIIPVLQSQVVEITDDRRTRKEILDDCKRLHGLTNKAICQEAQVLESELYRWAQDDKAPRPIKNTSAPHRRLIMVLTSPVRPRVLPLL
jgi:hypothetical protein